MFWRKKGYTGIKILTTDKMGGGDVKKVYDLGHGAFIYSWIGGDLFYLKAGGGIDNEAYLNGPLSVNGDPVTWKPFDGDIGELKFYHND